MKLTAKLLSLVLALSMVAGCGITDKSVKTDEELVEEIAKGYMDACCDLDIKATLDYIAPDSEMYKAHSEIDVDEFLNEYIPAEVSLMLGEENMDKIIDKILGMMSYELGEIEVNEEDATVDYVMSVPDFNSVAMDEDEMLSDLGIDDEEALMEIMLNILDVKDEDAAQEKLSSMTEEEATAFMMEVMEEVGMIDYIIDLLGEAEKTETDGTIELEKIDGEWLIISDE